MDFIVQHPHWAAVLVFLTAMSEAIALIGLFIPGTAILIGVGAVAGLGKLALWPIIAAATLGAITGDGISYWLGHRHKARIRTSWPFRQRPELLAAGETFFRRYGAMSVALGRFVPAVRAIIPLIAGVAGMPPRRFYLVNVLSAIVWAPAHILPGAGLGLAFGVLGSISGKLVLLLVAVLIILGLGIWVIRLGTRWLASPLCRAYRAFIDRRRDRDTAFDSMIVRPLDPDDPGTPTLLVLGVVMIALVIAFIGLAEDVVSHERISQMDQALNTLAQGFRTPALDRAMVVITGLGDGVVATLVSATIVIWLLLQRKTRLAVGFAATMLLASLSVQMLKVFIASPRPIELYAGSDAFSFPSGHATSAATLYASVAWLVSRNASLPAKVCCFALAGVLVGAIGLSRIYLSAHWPSDVMAGLILGATLASAFGLVFRRTDILQLQPMGLASVVLVSLLGIGTWHAFSGRSEALAFYRPRIVEPATIAASAWLGGGWRDLPAWRGELDGSPGEALVLQLGADQAVFRNALVRAGWLDAQSTTPAVLPRFLAPNSGLETLPPLPRTHIGSFPRLVMVRPTDNGRFVLRFWPTNRLIKENPDGPHPLLVGSIRHERVAHPLGLVTTLQDTEMETAEQIALLHPLVSVLPLGLTETDPRDGRRLLISVIPHPVGP